MKMLTALVPFVIGGGISLFFSEVRATDCYAIGERCAGAPGYDAVEWRCCADGGFCDETRPNDWGVFCRAADTRENAAVSGGRGQCASSGEKCAGAEGRPFVAYKNCCSSTDECREASNLGWGQFCVSRELKTSGNGLCANHRERCGGAEGYPYFPPKECCSTSDECRAAPELGWGLHCVEKLIKSSAPASKGILFPQSYPSITEEFNGGFDFNSWYFSSGYSNGQPFNNGWSNANYRIQGGALLLDLKKEFFPSVNGNPSHPYTGAEISSSGFYGVGCYSVCMRPSGVSGVSSSFYIHAGEYDTPLGFKAEGAVEMNEIDIEFVGKDTTRVQTNFFRRIKDPNANSGSGREQMIDLGFDASKEFHAYAFRWTTEGARWYVDGREVRAIYSRDEPFPDPRYSTLRMRANIWAVNKQAEEWAGPLDHGFDLTSAAYRWMKFVEGSECKVETSC